MTYSVIVIRDEDQLIPARYICQFFKLCGIYTYDYQCRSRQETQASLIVLVLIASY